VRQCFFLRSSGSLDLNVIFDFFVIFTELMNLPSLNQ
jgi:hypothetical protein